MCTSILHLFGKTLLVLIRHSLVASIRSNVHPCILIEVGRNGLIIDRALDLVVRLIAIRIVAHAGRPKAKDCTSGRSAGSVFEGVATSIERQPERDFCRIHIVLPQYTESVVKLSHIGMRAERGGVASLAIFLEDQCKKMFWRGRGEPQKLMYKS